MKQNKIIISSLKNPNPITGCPRWPEQDSPLANRYCSFHNNRMRTVYTLITLTILITIFGAGVLTGISYTGKIAQVTRNIDLSDYISLSLITLLSVALILSLIKSRPS
jgi:hypothetical protein